jgi:TPR repeat protein
MGEISSKLREALGAVAKGDAAGAIPVLEEEAQQGAPEAQFTLGSLYANGDGVPLNYTKAAHWIGRAAEAGLTAAQPVMAWLCANGYGVEQDDAKAREWYLRAAEGRDADAQLALAVMYQFGRFGAEKDPARMLAWYQRAAQQGHPKAQFALGKLMAHGDLVQQDDEAAFQWLTLAIMNGSEPAKQELAMLTGRLKEAQVEAFKQRMLEAMTEDRAR